MIKFENTEVLGWEHAIRGCRNPLNSWDRSDSLFLNEDGDYYNLSGDTGPAYLDKEAYPLIGSNDINLMKRLAAGGPVHAKYRRMIVVYVDITAPLYFWKQFDQYKVGTVTNSCSTMHKIAAKEFTLEDFSCEHLNKNSLRTLEYVLEDLNHWRNIYINGGMDDNYDGTSTMYEPKDKDAWWQMIQLLPSSCNQKRTVMLNYEVLAGIYPMRKEHKLNEWHDFCDWIKKLPYSELITGENENVGKCEKIGVDFEEQAEVNFMNDPFTVQNACKILLDALQKHGELYDGFKASITSAIKDAPNYTPMEKFAERVLNRMIGEE